MAIINGFAYKLLTFRSFAAGLVFTVTADCDQLSISVSTEPAVHQRFVGLCVLPSRNVMRACRYFSQTPAVESCEWLNSLINF